MVQANHNCLRVFVQHLIRSNDIADTRDKLLTYAAAGLLTLSKGSEMPRLNSVNEKE